MSKRIVVAIDGPAGAGKSTIAKGIAARLGFVYVDTGAMYRAVALWARRLNIDTSDMHRLEQLALEANIEFAAGESTVLLNGEDITEAIREPAIADAASQVSAVPGVRRALVDKQREMAGQNSIVMEGRDIGSVVFPDAAVKIYLDADPDVRTARRTAQLLERGETVAPNSVARDISVRDARDRTRAESPLVQAPDAVYVDTTSLNAEEVEETILRLVRARTSNGKELAR